MAAPGRNPYRPGPLGPLAWPRAILFYVHIALATLVIGLGGLPLVMVNRRRVRNVGNAWVGYLVRCTRWHFGLTCEVRGTPPAGDCIVASKHQSFWDILVLAHMLPRRVFIMKREMMRVPIVGVYARAVGCIPIDRSRGAEAMTRIVDEVKAAMTSPRGLGQLIIYPEGTRTLPGEHRRYKHGVASIAVATGLPVIPVAVNVGMFWPRRGIPIRPGRAIIEFLPPLPPGLTPPEILGALSQQIEGSSDALLAEAGFENTASSGDT